MGKLNVLSLPRGVVTFGDHGEVRHGEVPEKFVHVDRVL
jgi:hypothetical protein